MKDMLPYITARIEQAKAQYEVHSFNSGAVMIDIFIDDRFYVIQINGDEIGLSQNTEDTIPFDTRPDRSFRDVAAFKREFEKVFLEKKVKDETKVYDGAGPIIKIIRKIWKK